MKHVGFIVIFFTLSAFAKDVYHVGYKNIEFQTTSSKVHARIWYPISAKELENNIPTASFLEPFHGKKDADIVAIPGKLPLLLISHGSGSMVERLDWIANDFARRGWIVAGFNHPGNSYDNNTAEGFLSVWNRSKDISKFLTYLLSEDPIASKVDSSKIFVLGHSAGGAAVLMLGGAKFSSKNFTNPLPFCEPAKNPDLDDERCSELKNINYSNFSKPDIEHDYMDRRFSGIIAIDPGFARSFDTNIQPAIPTMILLAASLKKQSGEIYAKEFPKIFPKLQSHIVPNSIHISFLSPCNSKGKESQIPLCVGDKNRNNIQKYTLTKIHKFIDQ